MDTDEYELIIKLLSSASRTCIVLKLNLKQISTHV